LRKLKMFDRGLDCKKMLPGFQKAASSIPVPDPKFGDYSFKSFQDAWDRYVPPLPADSPAYTIFRDTKVADSKGRVPESRNPGIVLPG